MKTPNLKRIVSPSLVLVVSAVVLPTMRASDEKPDAETRKARREAEVLKKYDANHDGKLDDAEKAVRKADKEKARAEREARKRERAEQEAAQEQEGR